MTHREDPANQFRMLHVLSQESHLSQREMARRLELSLGKTNHVLGELIEEGWVSVVKGNNENHHKHVDYVLTSTGQQAHLNIGHQLLKQKKSEFERLKLDLESVESHMCADESAHHIPK